MATVPEQAIEWIHQALHFDESVESEIVGIVPSIPLSFTGMPYCEACRVSYVAHVGIAICETLFPFLARSAQTIMTIWAQIAQPGGKCSMQFRQYNI